MYMHIYIQVYSVGHLPFIYKSPFRIQRVLRLQIVIYISPMKIQQYIMR